MHCKKPHYWIFLFCLIFFPVHCHTAEFSVQKLVSDTLWVTLDPKPIVENSNKITVNDSRFRTGRHLAVTQINRWMYIPVDRYVVLNEPLAESLVRHLHLNSSQKDGMLSIEFLSFWQDKGPVLSKGLKLSAQTAYQCGPGEAPVYWQFEIHLPRHLKSKKTDRNFAALLGMWYDEIQEHLNEYSKDAVPPAASHPYKRRLDTWIEGMVFPSGTALNARMLLDYPKDQQDRWVRGNPGIYYLKMDKYESVAIGGWEQFWYRRWRNKTIVRTGFSMRVGFNSFDPDYFDHIEWYNIFLVQASLQAHADYQIGSENQFRIGIGFIQCGNILPDIVDRTNTGAVLSFGVVLQ